MLLRASFWLILGIGCILPVGWMVVTIASHPASLHAISSERVLGLWARTVGYNVIAGVLSLLLAWPVAVAMGRDERLASRLLWWVVAIPLLLPSIVIGYGWTQVLRLLHLAPMPQSAGDIARCIGVLATWLWPISAVTLALAMRRMDRSVLEQAMLDGALRSTLMRRLTAPMIAAISLATMLALQEFSVYETTGISVVSTEIRMIFETGRLSSSDNPIAGLQGGVSARDLNSDLAAQSALALSAGLPLVATIVLFALIGWRGVRQLVPDEQVEISPIPSTLRASWLWTLCAWAVVIGILFLPLGALVYSLRRKFDLPGIYEELAPQLGWSVGLSISAALLAGVASVLALRTRSLWPVIVSTFTFLIGGQFLAIAILRIYNHSMPALGVFDPQRFILDSNFAMVLAYFGRFAWIALATTRSARGESMKGLQELAATDGATAWQTILRVILPIAWPLVLAGIVMVGVLSLTEVPATALLVPPTVVPMLLTWVHMQRYGPMLEASLLLASVAIGFALVVACLIYIGRWRLRTIRKTALVLAVMLLLQGCGKSTEPDEIWLTTGRANGAVVYPRAITFDKVSNTFFVVDRAARIQHFDADGKFMNGWQMDEWMNGKPVGLTVGPDGNLWVADTHYHRVIVFSPQGQELKRFGQLGQGPGEFELVTDIAFDDQGRAFVGEYDGHDRIQVFDKDLKFLYSFGSFGEGDGQFSRPQSIVILKDEVYVTDACNHRIAVFKTDGTFVRNMGHVGSGPGEFRFPYGLELDRDNNLIVTEFGNNRLQKIDRMTGKSLGVFGKTGRLPGEFAYPWAATVDNRGRVIAVDSGNNRLQVFRF